MYTKKNNDVVIYKSIYKNLKYNTKFSRENNCDVIIMTNGKMRRLNIIENNIINPYKTNVFNRNKIDSNNYIVYQVNKNYFEGTWGGNVEYLDKRFNNIQEKVFIRVSYLFNVFQPENIIKLICDNQKEYTSKNINLIINKKIDNVIKTFISESLNEIGFINLQNKLFVKTNQIIEKINEKVISIFGLSIKTLNLIIEESEDHYLFRKEHEWNKIRNREGV